MKYLTCMGLIWLVTSLFDLPTVAEMESAR